jgi:RimJ/RimL family protein N-acetyltransferase
VGLSVSVANEADVGEFITRRLKLRSAKRSDVGLLHEAIVETLTDLVKWLPWARPGHRKADTRRYVRGARAAMARRGAYEFVIEELETGNIVGITSLHRIDWIRRSAGVGYWVRRSCWGKGLATEAVDALTERGFQIFRLHRLEAHVALDNLASQRVVEKLGFEREGVARAVEYLNGRYVDHIQYSLIHPSVSAQYGERA